MSRLFLLGLAFLLAGCGQQKETIPADSLITVFVVGGTAYQAPIWLLWMIVVGFILLLVSVEKK